MEKRYKEIICTLGLILVISYASCKKDYLEVAPIGSVSQQTLATKAGVNGLLIGAYALLDDIVYSSYDGGCSNWPFSDLASHEMVRGGTSFQEVGQFEHHSVDPTNTTIEKMWNSCYNGIQRANDVLRVLPLIPASQLTSDEALQLKAEAIFIRAVQHFELAKCFLHVPYVDETVTFTAGNYDVPNNIDIWPKIEADFKFAADNLTATKTDVGRPNSWAAKAFLAEVYMADHDYTDALPLLTACINNGVTPKGLKYALVNYPDNFDASKENNAEDVFSVQYCVNDGGLGNNADQPDFPRYPFLPITSGGGFAFVTFDLVNSFKTDSITGLPLFDTYDDFNVKNDEHLTDADPFTPYTGTLDPRLDQTICRRGIPVLDWGLMRIDWVYDPDNRGCYAVKKLMFKQTDVGKNTESYQGWDNVSNINYNMIRFADVLLRAAECEVEVGSLANAEAYVNQVRARAADPAGWVKTYIDNNNPMGGFTNTPAAKYFVGSYTGQFAALGKDYALKAIHFERRMELAIEGHRFFDLQRWDNGTGSMATEINRILNHENNNAPARFDNLKGAIFTQEKNEIYPIPQPEIDLSNVNGKATLVQNPGY
jgi:starch-binding outer membrane protein, SusD/RagB family